MRKQLAQLLEERAEQLVGRRKTEDEKLIRKQDLFIKRKAEIVKAAATGRINNLSRSDQHDHVRYQVHYQYLINQQGELYMEEEIEERTASFYKGAVFKDEECIPTVTYMEERDSTFEGEDMDIRDRAPFIYDRMKAVQYAERWWNDYNPAFEKFEVDCTNYISQCLYAGGAPMRSYPNRTKGWWYRNKNWSFSWSVANAMKTFLQHSRTGLRAKEVKDPMELLLGDVICYDFQGDGRYDHNTIVTGKDVVGMPLVNAHTYNSRMRYWAYEDSTAYTPSIQYKMFTIIDDS